MPQSLVRNLIHLVYSTKNRDAVLDDAIRNELYAYKAGIFKNCDSTAIIIGGVADHVHILFTLSKNHALSKVVEAVKTGISKWIKTKDKRFAKFHWQRGYGAFSVSPSNAETVRQYIERQAEHHRRRTFRTNSASC